MTCTVTRGKTALLSIITTILLVLGVSPMAIASAGGDNLDLTMHWVGFASLGLFVFAYVFVILEEVLHLKKSIPVMLAAGLIWTLIGVVYAQHGDTHTAHAAVQHALLELAELFFFLLAAMTFVNTLEERGMWNALRAQLVSRGLSLRAIYWMTGGLAFVLSPIADNLTTALIMASVVLAVGKEYPKFVTVALINVVVAANAGGAWSPFGDITTLMVWQKGKVSALEFLVLFLPSLINWLIPAVIMMFAVPKETPPALEEKAVMRRGAIVIALMFVGTVALTVSLHTFLHLPPVLGMMGGMALLKAYSYYLHKSEPGSGDEFLEEGGLLVEHHEHVVDADTLDTFDQLARAEWDTLLFFYGIILCVGGLGLMGYMAMGSQFMYVEMGPTVANIIVGFASALIDNIPVMFAVLSMDPLMSHGQWLLVTLTAGVGGSMLAIGSAAGVAVMGQAKGAYTFMGHLKWSWAILLGYIASIAMHFWLNADLFHVAAEAAAAAH